MVTENFNGLVSQTLSAGSTQTFVNPIASGLGIPKLTTLTDTFLKYRFTKFRFRLLNNAGSHAGDSAVSYIGKTTPTTTVATLAEHFETNMYSFVSTTQTTHGNWRDVPSEILRGLLPWYQTQSGSSTPSIEEVNQGLLSFFGSGTSTLIVEVMGTIQMSIQVDPSNSPLSREECERRIQILNHRLSLWKVEEEKADRELTLKLDKLGFVKSAFPGTRPSGF